MYRRSDASTQASSHFKDCDSYDTQDELAYFISGNLGVDPDNITMVCTSAMVASYAGPPPDTSESTATAQRRLQSQAYSSSSEDDTADSIEYVGSPIGQTTEAQSNLREYNAADELGADATHFDTGSDVESTQVSTWEHFKQ